MPDLNVNASLLVKDGATDRPLNTSDFTAPATGAAAESTQLDVLAALGALVPAGVMRVIADADLSGHRLVAPQADSGVLYASSGSLADLSRPVWLTTGAIMTGQSGLVTYLGSVAEPSWSWTPGQPVYLGAAGVLTQTVPSLAGGFAFSLQVALATSATELFFNPKSPVVLS